MVPWRQPSLLPGALIKHVWIYHLVNGDFVLSFLLVSVAVVT